MPDQVLGDGHRGLVVPLVPDDGPDFPVGEEGGVAERHFPVLAEQVAGLEIEPLAGIDAYFRVGGEVRGVAGPSHKIGIEGESPVFQDEVHEIAMQVAGEMVKQGAGNYVGMLVAILMVREEGVIMAGFAIISMIGSSLASEIATMKVTEQIDAIRVLKVNPVHYLFTPRVIAGTLMMPLVVVVASLFGILGGAVASNLASGLTYKAYFDSVWFGLDMHDLKVCILKALSFGFVISLISCSCGMEATEGAKGVGIATTKAVVWSFVAIVILDLIFAAVFFY